MSAYRSKRRKDLQHRCKGSGACAYLGHCRGDQKVCDAAENPGEGALWWCGGGEGDGVTGEHVFDKGGTTHKKRRRRTARQV